MKCSPSNILTVLCTMLALSAINAQTLTPARVVTVEGALSRACPDRNAGTVGLGDIDARSNDIQLSRSFLCLGDAFQILHNGDGDVLESDPDPSTPPGVGYAWYTCPPSIDRSTLDDVITDPCILNEPPAQDGIYVYLDQLSGDARFSNGTQLGGQTIPDFFNAGDPIEIYFAPITVDAESGGQAMFESGPNAPCVHVNTAAAFSVVYLTPIQVRGISQRIDANGDCRGRFILSGGMPHFAGASVYDIQILHNNSGAIATPIRSDYGHDDEVLFDFPESGTYTVFVSDEKSCPLTFEMEVDCDEPVIFSIDDFTANPGDTVCFDVEVSNFDSISVSGFDVTWDPTVFEFVSQSGFLVPTDPASFLVEDFSDNGIIRISWLNTSDAGVTVADGTSFINICLRAIGDCADETAISVAGDLLTGKVDPFNPSGSLELPVVVSPGIAIINGAGLSGRGDVCPDDGTGTGSVKLTICGGTPPYTVMYSGPSGSGTVNIDPNTHMGMLDGLLAGSYTFDITDGNNLMVVESISIPSGTAHEVDLIAMSPECANGKGDGAISANVMPAGSYDYTWSTGEFNVDNIDALPNGAYRVTVTDQVTGCAVSAGATLNTPEITVDLTLTNASCPTSEDGQATAIASGGTPTQSGDYEYEWVGISQVVTDTSTVTGIEVGSYGLIVTDSVGCVFTVPYNIASDFMIVVDSIDLDTITCAGDSAGLLEVFVSTPGFPGTSAYAFEWRLNGDDVSPWFISSTNSVRNNVPLPSGTYFLRVTNFGLGMDCFIETQIEIDEPSPMGFEVVSISHDECNNNDDGSFSIRPFGGNVSSPTDYFLLWASPDLASGSPGLNGLYSASSLAAGTYFVTIYDDGNIANACSIDTFIVIEQEDGVEIIDIEVTPVSCGGADDGELIVTYTQTGTQSYDVSWVDQDGAMYSGDTITGLSPGTYTVTVAAQSGCSVTDSVTLVSPTNIILDSVQYDAPSCPGATDGSITVFASADDPLSYSWSDPSGTNSPMITGITDGTYSVTISTGSGCGDLVIDTLTLTAEGSFSAAFSSIQGASCPGICDGQAFVTITGETGTLQYTWSDGSNMPLATALCGGQQFVFVQDDACADTFFVDIPNADSMMIDITLTPPTCFGDNNGGISVQVSGNNPPFDILWEDNSSDNPRNNLATGTYMLTVTDVLGCMQTRTVELVDPDLLIATIDPADLQQITCAGRDDGAVAITVMGGAGMNTFDWTPSVSNTDVATGLTPGDYAVVVSDQQGCTDTVAFSISEPPMINFTLGDVAPVQCFGDLATFGVVSASGGVGQPYSFSVNNGPLIDVGDSTSLLAGTYTVAIFDASGCFISDTITIDQPDEISVDIGPDMEVQLGDSVRLGISSITNTFPVDSFLWTADADILSCMACPAPWAQPTTTHMVRLTVVDSAGCSAFDELILTVDTRRQVFIPTAFSPNNDGINDVFSVFTGRGIRSIRSMQVYNRWGGQVFGINNIDAADSSLEGWDGMANGELLTPDIYVYAIEVEFIDDRVITYRGEVNLIR